MLPSYYQIRNYMGEDLRKNLERPIGRREIYHIGHLANTTKEQLPQPQRIRKGLEKREDGRMFCKGVILFKAQYV